MCSNCEIKITPKKPLTDRLLNYIGAVILGIGCVGVVAFAHNQVTLAMSDFKTQIPTYRTTADGDVGCVIYRTQLSCFAVPDEPMPEPEAELTYDEAVDLLKTAMGKKST